MLRGQMSKTAQLSDFGVYNPPDIIVLLLIDDSTDDELYKVLDGEP
jgi:hypothetical protein